MYNPGWPQKQSPKTKQNAENLPEEKCTCLFILPGKTAPLNPDSVDLMECRSQDDKLQVPGLPSFSLWGSTGA